jgi:hypothetical protein
MPLLPSLPVLIPLTYYQQDSHLHQNKAVGCSPHDTPSGIGAASLNRREEMAVEVASEQTLPANSPNSGGQAAISGEASLQSPISLRDDSSMPACDQETEWQPTGEIAAKASVQHMMSPVTSPTLLSSPDWGGEIQDQVVKIVLVEWCGMLTCGHSGSQESTSWF